MAEAEIGKIISAHFSILTCCQELLSRKVDLYDFVVCMCSWYHICSRYQENSRQKFKEDNRNSKIQLKLSHKK